MQKKIKVVFITNILSSHQVGLWDSFAQFPDVEFTYLCTRKISSTSESRYKTELRSYCKFINDLNIVDFINSQDIILVGSVEDLYLKRLLKNRSNIILIFEHLFRFSKTKSALKNFYILFRAFLRNGKIKKEYNLRNVYLLAMSYHAAFDFSIYGVKKRNMYKFGYFPIYNFASNNDLEKKYLNYILYAGRNCEWKKPDIAVDFLMECSAFDKNYYMNMFGFGIEQFQFDRSLSINVHSEISNQEIKKEFLKAGLFIFPSTRAEGWGSVLGEAMAAGCIVFASKSAGSTMFLIKDGFNGFLFKNKKELHRKIVYFNSLDEKQKMEIRKNAIKTIKNEWNCEIASKRLHEFLLSYYKKQKPNKYLFGPLSKARPKLIF